MEMSLALAFFVLISLESFLGIFSNFFIISVISLNHVKHQEPMSGSDQIILALSISNVCYTCVAFSNILLFNFWPRVFLTQSHMAIGIFVAITFILTTSLWLTASLCFFYYVKIKNVTSSFLSQLKMRMNSLVPWMILTSVALSCFSSSLHIVQNVIETASSEGISVVHSSNRSRPHASSNGIFANNLYISFICSIIPFMISVMTTASTAYSLQLHRLKMTRSKTTSFSQGNVYESTIRNMIRLLIFYAIIYVALFLFYFNIFAPYSVGFWVFLSIMCSYGSSQSILLSLATMKLKKAWMKMFHLTTKAGGEDDSRE